MVLHCNNISHWLGAYTEWSLSIIKNINIYYLTFNYTWDNNAMDWLWNWCYSVFVIFVVMIYVSCDNSNMILLLIMILHLWLHNYVDVDNANIDNNHRDATGIGKLNIGYDLRHNPHLTHLVLWNVSAILIAKISGVFYCNSLWHVQWNFISMDP